MFGWTLVIISESIQSPKEDQIEGWSKDTMFAKEWVQELRPMAHFKKIGTVAQTMGNAHIIFHIETGRIKEDMTRMCELTKERGMDSSIEDIVDQAVKITGHFLGNAWKMLNDRCQEMKKDFVDMQSLWITGLAQPEEEFRSRRQAEFAAWWVALLELHNEGIRNLNKVVTEKNRLAGIVAEQKAREIKLEREQYILSEWLRSVDGVTDTENLSQIHSHEKEAIPDRSRRQLLAATALVVSFASLLYSASDLFHLSAQRDDSEIIEHLHHDEIDIATNQRSIRLLNKTVAGMITELETLNHFQTQYVMWSRAKEYLDYMMWGWSRITDGLGSLTMHQLSPRLLGPTELKKAILKIARRVERNGYVLGIKEIDDLYKLPVSHLAFRNGTVILFVHIPIKRTEQPLSVFQYLNAPFKFQNDSVAVPILKERYLMIDDDSSSYKSITPEMFALCQLSESKVNCPDDGVYHTSENMDCLAALFMRRNKPVYEK